MIVPLEFTLRIRQLLVSATYRFAALSTATPPGEYIAALVAGPPSPLYLQNPFPANVLIVPLVTFRALQLVSAM